MKPPAVTALQVLVVFAGAVGVVSFGTIISMFLGSNFTACKCQENLEASLANMQGMVESDLKFRRQSPRMNVWFKKKEFGSTENSYCWLFEFLQPAMVGMHVELQLLDDADNITNRVLSAPGNHVFAIQGNAAEFAALQTMFSMIPTRRNSSGYGVIVFNDELGTKNQRHEYLDFVKFVIRPYYFPNVYDSDSRFVWIPTCYLPGRGPIRPTELLPSSVRSSVCWYAGSDRAQRQELTAVMKESGSPCEVSVTHGYKEGLTPTEYRMKMQSIMFALCPAGNSPETHRLYEAWEAGAIPVMLESDMSRGFFNIIHAGAPILNASSWSNARDQILELVNSPGAIDALQRANILYYQTFKRTVAESVATLVRASFESSST